MQILLVSCALLLSGVLAENLDLLLLHNNDMHSRFEETAKNSATCTKKSKGCLGGFARTAHEIRRYRKLAEEGRGRPVLYLNAGDTYVGTAWFTVYKWKICADFLNVLMPDAMSLGNHEFDNCVKGLSPLLNQTKFPIIAANLKLDREPSLQTIRKSVTLEVNGRKIGIIGHLTSDTKIISCTENVEFLDVVDSIKKESQILESNGVNIIIVVGHSGFDMDKRIAAEVPLVDVVIGGHTNTFQWNGHQPDLETPEDLYPKVVVQKSGKEVPVVQAYAYTKYLGRLNVTFNEAGDLIHFNGQPELLDTTVPQDPDVLALLDKYRPQIEALNTKVVGKSHIVLEANTCRRQECNFGNLLADAFVYYMSSICVGGGWTDAPIGLVNGGNIRTTIDPTQSSGNITRGELLGSIPFGNQMISFKMLGSDLIKTLEIGVRSNGETSRGEFLQVSGLHVVYDLARPSLSRVVSVMVRCGNCSVPAYSPIVGSHLYGVISTSFLLSGGDGHTVLRDGSLNRQTQDLGDADIVEWYLDKQGIVYPEVQGRIRLEQKCLGSAGMSWVMSVWVLIVVLLARLL